MHTSTPVHRSASSPRRPERAGSPRGVLGSPRLPAVTVTALASAVVLYYGVSPRDLLLFGVYVVFC
ncbi:hypothetical protein IL992_45455, partial [Microbispora sp. NEAU-D428]|uniref:hypothetical protein n=1 Tax=Microbispora sitophila TaxID=2771537 RepID=UPI001867D6FE